MIDLKSMQKRFNSVSMQRESNGDFNLKKNSDAVIELLKHCAGEVVEAAEAYSSNCKSMLDFIEELSDIAACVLIVAERNNIDMERALKNCLIKNEKRAGKQQRK